MKYFNNIKTEEEAKKRYRELAKMLHPDTATGNTLKFQEMNVEYKNLCKHLSQKLPHIANETIKTKANPNKYIVWEIKIDVDTLFTGIFRVNQKIPFAKYIHEILKNHNI
jgi:hypothetical protein